MKLYKLRRYLIVLVSIYIAVLSVRHFKRRMEEVKWFSIPSWEVSQWKDSNGNAVYLPLLGKSIKKVFFYQNDCQKELYQLVHNFCNPSAKTEPKELVLFFEDNGLNFKDELSLPTNCKGNILLLYGQSNNTNLSKEFLITYMNLKESTKSNLKCPVYLYNPAIQKGKVVIGARA